MGHVIGVERYSKLPLNIGNVVVVSITATTLTDVFIRPTGLRP